MVVLKKTPVSIMKLCVYELPDFIKYVIRIVQDFPYSRICMYLYDSLVVCDKTWVAGHACRDCHTLCGLGREVSLLIFTTAAYFITKKHCLQQHRLLSDTLFFTVHPSMSVVDFFLYFVCMQLIYSHGCTHTTFSQNFQNIMASLGEQLYSLLIIL